MVSFLFSIGDSCLSQIVLCCSVAPVCSGVVVRHLVVGNRIIIEVAFDAFHYSTLVLPCRPHVLGLQQCTRAKIMTYDTPGNLAGLFNIEFCNLDDADVLQFDARPRTGYPTPSTSTAKKARSSPVSCIGMMSQHRDSGTKITQKCPMTSWDGELMG